MSYKDSDNTIVIAVALCSKCMNFGAETQFGSGVMSAFDFLSTAIAWAPCLDVC